MTTSRARAEKLIDERTAANLEQAADEVAGPRIYNLFPPLAGSIRNWNSHLRRIAGMNFNWVFVNSFHLTGGSGSIYAIKDPYALSDLTLGSVPHADQRSALKQFTTEARRLGMRVMMDLVVHHTARDAISVRDHPEWYRRNPDGTPYAPRVVDPNHHAKVAVWEDLAELDYETPSVRATLVEYWTQYVRHYAGLGFDGFRCDAAYQIPPDVWRQIISGARQTTPRLRFFAGTLGGSPEQVLALSGVGFDYIFNSAKWWDFRASWLIDQYEAFRVLAPSIAFPENHDTERVAALESEAQRAASLKFHLLFAACFSSGVMMPMGYEYGFRHKLDVVRTRPTDWEETGIDLTAFVAAVHAMKAAVPALNREGEQRRITAPASPLVGLLRLTGGHPVISDGCAIVLINPDRQASHSTPIAPLLAETGGLFDRFTDVTPMAAPVAFDPMESVTLEPLSIRVFQGERANRDERPAAPIAAEAPHDELDRLAANRITIERVQPELDGGRFPAKRAVGDVLEVRADIFGDGHDKLQARVKYRATADADWSEAPMEFFDNDRWVGRFPLTANTEYIYTIEAWRDLFGSWRSDLAKKRTAKQDIRLELQEGLALVQKAATRTKGPLRQPLEALLSRAEKLRDQPDDLADLLLEDDLYVAVMHCADRTNISRYPRDLRVIVDRQAALYSAWYELMPRSQSGTTGRSGTFDDVIARLPYVRDMGFDVLYFPPIHPIGRTNRKGRNNSLTAGPNDPGSPYAIGASEGGHTAIHPELGTLDDFKRLVRAAHTYGLEIALDFAIQCSPDHPWIKEHPEWFDWRPDGTIKFAENPPKKYEDIVNLHFYRDAYPAVWHALRDVVLFWVEQGVKIFRVDNPHTKPLPFWEWMISDVRRQHPDVIFLAEAFTRPKMMKRLAKVGFNQSYTYFTWRTTKRELTEYLTELTQEEPREYYRPNFFANTPDINPVHLQAGGRAAFIVRATLAATLSSVYGLYSGFELCEAAAIPGKEEYLNSEKYEIRVWDWDRPGNIRQHIAQLNRIRRQNPALHCLTNLRFYNAFNDQVLLYGKMTDAKDNAVLIAVNLDPHHPQECDFEVPLWEFGLPDHASIATEDLLSGRKFRWYGKMQHMHLDPRSNPCAIWRLTPMEAQS
ncbi:MAG TPA: maltotransferase domain-containing protein [Burkholderiales bacterium]|nr:maltotransferase domain-containing protein [Burkholderiales bacterium]